MHYSFTTRESIRDALGARGREQQRLFAAARAVRHGIFGNRVETRSVIEYSNICRQGCRYCGMSRGSGIARYVLSVPDVLATVRKLYCKGRSVIMFQTGENHSPAYLDRLTEMLADIKRRYPDITMIGSFGNLPAERYRALKQVGVDRYILKFETSAPTLYKQIKPTDTLENRLEHIRLVRASGMHISTGNIVGLPGQTIQSLIDDLLLMKKIGPLMGSTSVFIPNDASPYAHCLPGELDTALNFMAVLRIMCPHMLIPTTSSLETLSRNGQYRGLQAGANVVTFHDGTPDAEADDFVIYTRKRSKPNDSLVKMLRKAHLCASPVSLLRTACKETLYHRLVVRNAGRPAIITESDAYSYDDIHVLVLKFCGFLKQLKIKEGDVVLLAAHDSLEFVVAFLSCIRVGVVVTPVDPCVSEQDMRYILSDIRPQKIFCTDRLYRALHDARMVKIADDDSAHYFMSLMRKVAAVNDTGLVPDPGNPAIILLTSGTTGRPKGVVHRYCDLFVDTFPRTVLRLTGNDMLFCCSRMYTSFGLGNSLLFPFLAGARVVLSRSIPHLAVIERALRYRPSIFCAVPSMYAVMMEHARSLKVLLKYVRIFVVSGEKLSPSLYRRWKAIFGSTLLECFGNTEMCHSFISHLPGRQNAQSCGKALEGFSVKTGPDGRLYYAGPTLFSGYYRNCNLTKRRLVDGFFRSDDRGYVDSRGFVFITGRDNMVFKHHGQWVSLLDIEHALNRLRGIAESMAVKVGDDLQYYVATRGQKDPTALIEEIRRLFVRTRQLHLLPSAVHIVTSVPRTKNGKIDREVQG